MREKKLNCAEKSEKWENLGRRVVPFKTMAMPSSDKVPGLKYYGGMAFGRNVFLQWHTDHDFTMSVVQVYLRGKDKYEVNDDIFV